MSKIITFHSFRRGTGKSSLISNVASLLAVGGARIGVIDTDFQFPGLHILFNLKEEDVKYSINDYLRGKCEILDAAHDVTDQLGVDISGQVFLVPASIRTDESSRILRDGYDEDLLNDGFQNLMRNLELDYLIIDTHPGLNEETLLTAAISDALIVVMRPDQQDYQGTAILMGVARHLYVSVLLMIVNKTPRNFDYDVVRKNVEDAYDSTVAAVLPHSEEMTALGSSGIFSLRYPEHEISKGLEALAARLQDL